VAVIESTVVGIAGRFDAGSGPEAKHGSPNIRTMASKLLVKKALDEIT
jgi:hypothetical protein